MTSSRTTLYVTLALLVAGFGWLYADVIQLLVRDWATDDNYSHGFLIVPIAAYLAWERRGKLAAEPMRPNWFGMVVVLGSIGVLAVGVLGAEMFLTRLSMLGVLGGGILFLGGWRHLRTLTFPLAFLLLMIPIPSLLFNQIAFPLQLLASRVGEASLSAAGIPVLREGNVIILANTSLEVAEACSGIRSLISLLALGIVFGYFTDRRTGVRVTVALLTIPIAVVTNGMRVAGTGFAAHFYGSEAAEGFFHTFSGWLVFAAALGILGAMQHLLQRLHPAPILPASTATVEV